jgi:hypothetical protein
MLIVYLHTTFHLPSSNGSFSFHHRIERELHYRHDIGSYSVNVYLRKVLRVLNIFIYAKFQNPALIVTNLICFRISVSCNGDRKLKNYTKVWRHLVACWPYRNLLTIYSMVVNSD